MHLRYILRYASSLSPLSLPHSHNICTVLSIIAFRKRHSQFTALLSNHSGLSPTRYFRLMAIAAVDLMFTVPLSVYVLALDVQPGVMQPWISWADTHFAFDAVYVFPVSAWQDGPYHVFGVVMEVNRWVLPLAAFVFFAVFGVTDDARSRYAKVLGSVRTCMGWSTLRSGLTAIGSFGNTKYVVVDFGCHVDGVG